VYKLFENSLVILFDTYLMKTLPKSATTCFLRSFGTVVCYCIAVISLKLVAPLFDAFVSSSHLCHWLCTGQFIPRILTFDYLLLKLLVSDVISSCPLVTVYIIYFVTKFIWDIYYYIIDQIISATIQLTSPCLEKKVDHFYDNFGKCKPIFKKFTVTLRKEPRK